MAARTIAQAADAALTRSIVRTESALFDTTKAFTASCRQLAQRLEAAATSAEAGRYVEELVLQTSVTRDIAAYGVEARMLVQQLQELRDIRYQLENR